MKFVQIAVRDFTGDLFALDSLGQVWQFTRDPYGWIRLSMQEVKDDSLQGGESGEESGC